MRRRVLLAILLMALLAFSTLAFTACKCKHKYDSTTTKEPTCTQTGTILYTCRKCGDSYTDTLETTNHNYTAYTSTATHHRQVCSCGATTEEETHTSSGPATQTQAQVCTKCGYEISPKIGIRFETLTADGDTLSHKVSNATDTFSFANEITCNGGATYILSASTDVADELPTQTLTLNIGDNTVYIIEIINNQPTAVYTVVIRRKPVYAVSFNTNGGSAIETIYVEEGELLTPPTTTNAGYAFEAWDYDFTTPITTNITITASWTANTDTAYTVEYYVKNPNADGYVLHKTETLFGTTGAEVSAEPLSFDFFIYDATQSITGGHIRGDGTLVLQIYYIREQFSIHNQNADIATISHNGTFDYGSPIELSVLSTFLGYRFVGWYSGETLLSTEPALSLILDKDVEAKFEMLPEMAPFTFTSTETTCTITSILDKTVTEIFVPDYVTSIAKGAFASCSALQSITIPFVGANKGATVAGESTLFGYIFGSFKYTGGEETSQSYQEYTSVKYYIPTALKTVTVTGGPLLYGAFTGCNNLTTVILSDGVTSIGDSAFANLKGLSSITMGNGITEIGSGAFTYCKALYSVDIPDSVTTIGANAFADCDKLAYLTIGLGVKSIGEKAFVRCSGMMTVNTKDIAAWCQISFADSNANPLYNGMHTLILNGEYFVELNIPEGVTSISPRAFIACTSIMRITFPSTLTTIGQEAFYACQNFDTLNIPDSVTTIGISAFTFCTRLSTVTIGTGLTSIPAGLFAHCTSLTTINYRGSEMQWNNLSKGTQWNFSTKNIKMKYNYTGK